MWTPPRAPALTPAPRASAPRAPTEPPSPTQGALELLLGGTSCEPAWGTAVCLDYLAAHAACDVPGRAMHLLERSLGLQAPGLATATVAAGLLPAVRERCPQLDQAMLWPEVEAFSAQLVNDAAERRLHTADLCEDAIVEAVVTRALTQGPTAAYALFAALAVMQAFAPAEIEAGARDGTYRLVARAAYAIVPTIWYGVLMGIGPRPGQAPAERHHLVRVVALLDALAPSFRADVLAVPLALRADDAARSLWRRHVDASLPHVFTQEQLVAAEALLASPEGRALSDHLPGLARAMAERRACPRLRADVDGQVDEALAAIADDVAHARCDAQGVLTDGQTPAVATRPASPGARVAACSPSGGRLTNSLWPRVPMAPCALPAQGRS